MWAARLVDSSWDDGERWMEISPLDEPQLCTQSGDHIDISCLIDLELIYVLSIRAVDLKST
jgi:hypothetical protein